MIKYNWVQ